MSGVWDTQPDLAVHLRATLSCSLAKAVAPTFWRHIFVNITRVGNIFSRMSETLTNLPALTKVYFQKQLSPLEQNC